MSRLTASAGKQAQRAVLPTKVAETAMYVSPLQPSMIETAARRNRASPVLGFVVWALLGMATPLLVGTLGPGPSSAPCGDDPASVRAGP
ncbi:MAG: hypothetical protein JOZ42_13580 [Acetobacteraceae bacterium]|nr:hypothetical protein [Acetobacteraceae bacterium]